MYRLLWLGLYCRYLSSFLISKSFKFIRLLQLKYLRYHNKIWRFRKKSFILHNWAEWSDIPVCITSTSIWFCPKLGQIQYRYSYCSRCNSCSRELIGCHITCFGKTEREDWGLNSAKTKIGHYLLKWRYIQVICCQISLILRSVPSYNTTFCVWVGGWVNH